MPMASYSLQKCGWRWRVVLIHHMLMLMVSHLLHKCGRQWKVVPIRSQVCADADASGVTLASQLWLDMEGGADPVNADADGIALASQIWLDIERGGDQV